MIGVQSAANLAVGLETAIRRGRPLCLPSLRNVHLQRGQAWKPAPTGLFMRFEWLNRGIDLVAFIIEHFASLDTLRPLGLTSD
jgi:hypothetical protein